MSSVCVLDEYPSAEHFLLKRLHPAGMEKKASWHVFQKNRGQLQAAGSFSIIRSNLSARRKRK